VEKPAYDKKVIAKAPLPHVYFIFFCYQRRRSHWFNVGESSTQESDALPPSHMDLIPDTPSQTVAWH
jgi:hypothetical protein